MVDVGAMTEENSNKSSNFLIYNGCSAIIIGGTGSGKQLDDNTPLPTPTGWTTMGEVQIGDYVNVAPWPAHINNWKIPRQTRGRSI